MLAGKFENETEPWLGRYFKQKICWEFCKISVVAGKIKCFLLAGRRKKTTTINTPYCSITKAMSILKIQEITNHLHQRIVEHHFSAIGKHFKNDNDIKTIEDLTSNFSVLKKCNGKLDCFIYKMLFIKNKKACLNTQSDSIRAGLF